MKVMKIKINYLLIQCFNNIELKKKNFLNKNILVIFCIFYAVNVFANDLNLTKNEKNTLSASYLDMWSEWNSCWYNKDNKMTKYADKLITNNIINNYEKFELEYWYALSDKVYAEFPFFDYSECDENKPSEAALKWKKRNKWFGVDEDMTNFSFLIHQNLINEGVIVDSYEYYYEIDQRMREKFPNYFTIDTSDKVIKKDNKFKKPIF